MIKNIRDRFRERFGGEPVIVASPGRVNLIGEHTDYNDGFVLPAAIDKCIYLGLAANGKDTCTVYASSLNESYSFNINEVTPYRGWTNYILGVVHHLQNKGYQVGGFDAVLDGEVPIGSGLSSSAAVEGAVGIGLCTLFNIDIPRFELARIGQLAEHTFVGVKCGIMDQFANLHGKKDQLIRLDCRSLEYEYFPFHFPGYKIVLCNSMVHHSLASSEYNTRRLQCEEGVAILKRFYPAIKNLRDVTLQMIHDHEKDLPEIIYSRCCYVVEENDRVLRACQLLKQDDLPAFGQLMYQAHEGLSKLYEVSCEELDCLVELARQRKEVAGARMMGGGFGGCTINIVEAGMVDAFRNFITENYQRRFDKTPEIYVTSIEDGARVVRE
ncbi:MAG TPA: galactokinase [Chitinophagaceae bacterium]